MMNILSKYADEDGLININCINFSQTGSIFIDDIPIEATRHNSKIFDYLSTHKKKFDNVTVKICFEVKKEGRWSSSAAPIIGISFQEGLKKVLSGSITAKSMFYFEQDVSEYGIEGRLIASYERRNNEIIFQLWEITKYDIEVFYLHGVFDVTMEKFIHFDGALVWLSSKTKEKMKKSYLPIAEEEKKVPYQKLFRLDAVTGGIAIADVMELADNFLPIEDLSQEFLVKEKKYR